MKKEFTFTEGQLESLQHIIDMSMECWAELEDGEVNNVGKDGEKAIYPHILRIWISPLDKGINMQVADAHTLVCAVLQVAEDCITPINATIELAEGTEDSENPHIHVLIGCYDFVYVLDSNESFQEIRNEIEQALHDFFGEE